MNSKKWLAALLACVMLIGTLAGCGGNGGSGSGDTGSTPPPASSDSGDSGSDASGDAGSETKELKDIHVGFVVKSLADSFYVLMKAGAEAKAEELGIQLTFIAPNSESDTQGQVDMIQNLLGQNIDALCVAPSSVEAVLPVFEQADSMGIPILAVDNDTIFENKLTFIGTGSEAAGELGGQYAAEQVGEGAKAIILRGRLGDSNHDAREAGFTKGLEAGGVEILEVKACDSEAEKGMNAMQDLMNRYPDIDIVCTTADSMAQGAQRAIEQAGVDIPVLGFDGTIPVAEMTAQGLFMGTVAQDPYNMGVVGVEEAVKAVQGEHVEPRIDTGAKIVNQENAAEFVADLNAKMGN